MMRSLSRVSLSEALPGAPSSLRPPSTICTCHIYCTYTTRYEHRPMYQLSAMHPRHEAVGVARPRRSGTTTTACLRAGE